MERRLRDQTGGEEAVAAKLLSACAPHVAPSDRKDRVWSKLEQRAKARSGSAALRRWALRPAFAATVFFFLIAAASAMFGRAHFRKQEIPVEPVVKTLLPPAEVTPSPPVVVTPPVAPSINVAAPSIDSATHARSPSHLPKEAAANPEEMAEVLAAFKALRQAHDPKHAGALLDHYLKRYPRGALLEEALALAIEAAAAQQDPHAGELATRYLAKFPHGRFVKSAEQAKKRFPHR